MITKILPFLNKLIPTGLAFKGLGKVSPKIGKYLSTATAAGYGAEEALDYLRQQLGGESPDKNLRPDEQAANARVGQGAQIPNAIGKAAQIGLGATGIGTAGHVIGSLFGAGQGGPEEGNQPQASQIPSQPSEQPKQVSPDQVNIAQYSPDLLAFIEHWLGQGEDPATAASVAKNNPKNYSKFKRAIDKIEQDTGVDFVELITQMYKGVNKGKNKVVQGQQQAQVPSVVQKSAQPTQQGMGQGEARLTQALDRLAKMRGG